MTTPRLSMEELEAAQSQPEIPVNEDLRLIDVLLHLRILDKDLGTPPGSPAAGDAYIVAGGPTGAWVGHQNDIAFYADGWRFCTPQLGFRARVVDEGAWYLWAEGSPQGWTLDGSGGGGGGGSISVGTPGSPGVQISDVTDLQFVGADVQDLGGGSVSVTPILPYDVGSMFNGAITASMVLLRFAFARAVNFADGWPLSRGVAGTASTTQCDFDIKKNGSSVGTMRFAAGGTVASFLASGAVSFAAGDILTVVAPGSPDATLAGLAFTLAGVRA